jgi:YesN/AraC family two-component response regulator
VPDNNIPVLVESLMQIFQTGKNYNTSSLLGYLYLLLAALEESYLETENIKMAKNTSSIYIEKAVQYISYNYHKPITVMEISKYTGLDRTYFSKLFHKHVDSTPQEYIVRYRIRKALELMQTTDLNIDEVCKCVGIPENYYFTRVFKRVMGCTPSQYRKTLA